MPKKSRSQQYDYLVMSFDAINAFRIREGFPPTVRGERTCICCKKQFESEDMAHIRICRACKNLKEARSGGIRECSFAL